MGTEIKASIAAEAVGIVNGARRAAYGTPERNFGRIARLWEAYLQLKSENRLLSSGKFTDTEASVIVEAIRVEPLDIAAMMRLMKEARLIESPDHRDSYVDLVGYTLCGGELALPPVTIDGTAQEVTVEPAPMVEPPAAPEPKFKPGQRVRYWCEDTLNHVYGNVVKTKRIDSENCLGVYAKWGADTFETWVDEAKVELVPEASKALDAFPVGQRVKLPNAPGLGTVTDQNPAQNIVAVKWDDGGKGWFIPEDLVALEGTTPARPVAEPESIGGFKVGDRVNLKECSDHDNPGEVVSLHPRDGMVGVLWGRTRESFTYVPRRLKHLRSEATAL